MLMIQLSQGDAKTDHMLRASCCKCQREGRCGISRASITIHGWNSKLSDANDPQSSLTSSFYFLFHLRGLPLVQNTEERLR